MRIVGGNLRGRKIFQPKDKKTRPLRDLVKESVFNLLEHSSKFNCRIENSEILDLFSGVGSFGIECISRNAKKVTFVENYKNSLKILKMNIFSLNIKKKCKINEQSCFEFCDLKNSVLDKFNIIFMDPPYRESKINSIIENIIEKKILKKDGILIIHRHKKDSTNITSKLKILDERSYGISKIIIGN